MFGAGVADTGGVNRLPPVGSMLFSVGEGGLLGAGVAVLNDVVGDVGVVVAGAWVPLLAQPAVTAPIEATAMQPMTTFARRTPVALVMARGPFGYMVGARMDPWWI
jgi:hypothetical protein